MEEEREHQPQEKQDSANTDGYVVNPHHCHFGYLYSITVCSLLLTKARYLNRVFERLLKGRS